MVAGQIWGRNPDIDHQDRLPGKGLPTHCPEGRRQLLENWIINKLFPSSDYASFNT